MGVVLIAPEGMEKVVMGNDERTEYRPRGRVVEVHPAHASALKMMGFEVPREDPAPEVIKPPTMTMSAAAELLKAAAPAEEKPVAASSAPAPAQQNKQGNR